MAARGYNPGVQMLEDFVCDAIPVYPMPQGKPTSQGRNAGIAVDGEIDTENKGSDKEGPQSGGSDTKAPA
jgi:hypothetical protein